ncbi:MAG: ABC transporter ATP-binding protein [Thermodesulfobacteriota bacterium]
MLTGYGQSDLAPEAIKPSLLKCTDIRFGYETGLVLDGVSVTIGEGACVGVIGPNGSGKSTLMRLLSGVLKPQSGRVVFQDKNMAELPRKEVARRLAVVAQEEVSELGLSVRDEVVQGRAPHHGGLYFETPQDWNAVECAMTKTGVIHLADRLVETLSGGERQRVRIARSLAQEPRVLLLDEPTNHLDLHAQLSLMELLRSINDEGIAILVMSHDVNFVAESCGHLKILHRGRFFAEGTPHDVITEANLAGCFQIRALVDTNPATDNPRMTPVARLIDEEC